MEKTIYKNFETEIQKIPLNNENNSEDWDILQTQREISLVVESIILKLENDSTNTDNEIPKICCHEDQGEHYEAVSDFGTTKKKKSQTNDISKLGSGVSSEDSSSTLKFSVDILDLENEIDFSFAKKKKKKKPAFIPENKVPTGDECNVVSNLLDNLTVSDSLISDNDCDYPYEYLLSRFFNLIREKDANVDKTARKKLIMKPPQVLRAGAKRSSLANFLELCKIMRRTPQHVQSFLVVELGTNGSIDSNGQLVIKGKFQQKQLESVLRRYIKEYVTCHTCHSPDTLLMKQTRLCFLQCEACGSRCSVPVIKSGYQAVINKRAVMRAKCN